MLFFFIFISCLRMLVVEVCVDAGGEIEMNEGAYRLGSTIGNDICICEYQGDAFPSVADESYQFLTFSPRIDKTEENITNFSQYHGTITIKDPQQIKMIKYTTVDSTISMDTFIQEMFPVSAYKGSWKSVIGDEEEKYNVLYTCMRLIEATPKSAEVFGINKCILVHGEPGIGKAHSSGHLLKSCRFGRTEN